MVEFDPLTASWTDLTGQVRGSPPVARYDHGFAAVDGVLYLFGGLNEAGEGRGGCRGA